MKKKTLNSYKRKIIVLGVLVFMSIGLISTGFAAWVMSTNPEKTETGNVSVGLIEDANLTINLNAAPEGGYNIAFEPLATDTTGRVRADSESAAEALSFTVTGTVSPAQYFGSLSYEFIIPQGVMDAYEKGYIELPKGATVTAGGGLVTLTQEELTATTVDEENAYQFSIVIEFKWGANFNGKNPGIYYDDDEAGKLVSDAECKKALEDLRGYVYGYYDELAAATDQAGRDAVIAAHVDDTLSFKLYITATTN